MGSELFRYAGTVKDYGAFEVRPNIVCIETAMNLWEGVEVLFRCQVDKGWHRIQDHLGDNPLSLPGRII